MAKTVSWMWKGKRYSGTLIRETATHKYARTKSGKTKTIVKKKRKYSLSRRKAGQRKKAGKERRFCFPFPFFTWTWNNVKSV